MTTHTAFRNFLFPLLPTIPSLFFGLVLVWQQGTTPTNISMASMTVLFSLVSGYFVWVWHSDHLAEQNSAHQQRYLEGTNNLKSYILELERLLLTIEPKLTEQVETAKELTEKEVSTLIRRFLVIREALKRVSDFLENTGESSDAEANDADALSTPVETINREIDSILESLQFQDRTSQILALVKENLITLSQTLVTIQQQGADRHPRMMKVDDMLVKLQTQFETVTHHPSPSKASKKAEEVTYF